MSGQQSKADLIAERQASLPLPEDPPTVPDWNSADGRNVNVGSGGVEADIDSSKEGSITGFREPAAKESGVKDEGGADVKTIGK
jgi:hypothetical protein